MNLEEKNTSSQVENSNPVTVNSTKGNVMDSVKNFSQKSFGKFKGLHIMIGACALLVLVIICCIVGMGGKKEVAYPAVYVNDDGDMMLMPTNVKKEEKAIKLASSSSRVVYANTTDRYVLFEKDGNLYLYDSKKKDETQRIVKEVSTYGFTEDDKYVFALDKDKGLYVYAFKKDAEKLDSDVSSIEDVSNDKIVYIKDKVLYIKSLNVKKDDREKITDDLGDSVRFSKDGKSVLYTNNDEDLYIYNISKKSSEKIAKNVDSFYANDKANKMYYTSIEEDDGERQTNIYFYNGKEATKVVSGARSIEDYDVDKELLVYSTINKDGKYTLYFQKGTKDAAEVEDGMKSLSSVYLFDTKGIYYVNGDKDLKYAGISGNKVGKVSTVTEDVSGYLTRYKSGFAFVAEVDKNSNGELYLAKGNKAKKIDSDVKNATLNVSNDGSKVYYGKNCDSSTCDLYVTSGGKGKAIEKNVQDYTYVTDKLIYIIKNDDLYRYTGKSVKVAKDVQDIATTPNYYDPEA